MKQQGVGQIALQPYLFQRHLIHRGFEQLSAVQDAPQLAQQLE
jgi:hypothetical protein